MELSLLKPDIITRNLGLQAVKKLDRSSTQSYVPVRDILDGVIVTEDGRYIRAIEVEPSNFEMLTPQEQKNIIDLFSGWLKTAPCNFQIKCTTSCSNVTSYSESALMAKKNEKSDKVKVMIDDYLEYLDKKNASQAVDHHFYFIFEHETKKSVKNSLSPLIRLT